jgi:hypothetical protein
LKFNNDDDKYYIIKPGTVILKNPRFCRVPVIGSLESKICKKEFQNRFLGRLNFEKGSGL